MAIPKANMEVARKAFESVSERMDVYDIAMFIASLKYEADRIERYQTDLFILKGKAQKFADEVEDFFEHWNNPNRREFMEEYEYLIDELFDDSNEPREPTTPCYVYYILNEEKDKVKIGISDNPMARAKQLQTACGEEIDLHHTIKFSTRSEAESAESFLHREFSYYRKRPSKVAKTTEWFDARILGRLMADYDTADKIQAKMKCQETYERKEMENVTIKLGSRWGDT